MSYMPLFELLIANLREELWPGRREYLTKEQAYEQLKYHTGQDFGFDIERWEQWVREHPKSIRVRSRQ